MDIKLYTVAAAICLLIGFTSCYHKSDGLQEDKTQLADDTIVYEEDIHADPVNIEVLFNFNNDSFVIKLKSRFSDYFTRIARTEDVSSFYDQRSLSHFKRPAYPQSLNSFYDGNYFSIHQPMIIAIYRHGQDTIAKLNFTRVDSLGVATPSATIDFGIKYQKDAIYLSNMLLINSENWLERRIGSITYYYPLSHDFSQIEAAKMEGFNNELAILFSLEPRKIRYYICDSYREIERLKGFDFQHDMFDMGEFGGLSDVTNGIIYSGYGSEYYPHELVHHYLPYWLETANINFWFSEGLCTFLGGSQGKDLEWHIEILKEYVYNEKLDLSDLNTLPSMFGDSTGREYVIGGLICKLAYEKGGMDAVKDLLLSGDHDESFYEGINFVLGVEKKDFPEYLMKELEKY